MKSNIIIFLSIQLFYTMKKYLRLIIVTVYSRLTVPGPNIEHGLKVRIWGHGSLTELHFFFHQHSWLYFDTVISLKVTFLCVYVITYGLLWKKLQSHHDTCIDLLLSSSATSLERGLRRPHLPWFRVSNLWISHLSIVILKYSDV